MRSAYPNELYHYGILGMKWGVRRYQNPDGSLTAEGAIRYRNTSKYERKGGSYTKRGIERYKKAAEKYNEAKKNKDTNYYAYKKAKYEEKKAYKQLKKDYRADQGKELYARGNTIGKVNTDMTIATLGLVGYGFSIPKIHRMLSRHMPVRTANITQASLNIGVAAAYATLYGIKSREAENLRAYYAH